MDNSEQFKTIDEYIESFSEEVGIKLQTLRHIIKEEVPDAEETMSYKMPTFKRNGSYVAYFAAYKNYISLYPTSPDIEKIRGITKYKKHQGTLQFPLDQPLPLPLIRQVVRLMANENTKRTERKVFTGID
jgi:uncharacterized protein YdhG (YjbR/CyaY superfamily)